MRRLTPTTWTHPKRRVRHLRLVVEMSFPSNLDAARGIINGLMVSSLFWLIALMLYNV